MQESILVKSSSINRNKLILHIYVIRIALIKCDQHLKPKRLKGSCCCGDPLPSPCGKKLNKKNDMHNASMKFIFLFGAVTCVYDV